jgi:hypothetical protein
MKLRRGYKPHWRDPIGAENVGDVVRLEPATRYSRELLDETKVVWQPYYEKPLNDEDAREIIENMVSFVAILVDHRERTADKAKTDKKPGNRRR